MEHIATLKILLCFLTFEIIVGAWIGFVYSNLWHDWKAINKERQRLLKIGKEWERFKVYVKDQHISFSFKI